ncbi:MAG: ornithine carbamoyltransferase, partial [bacterium]
MVATLKGRDVLRITDMSSEEISALLNLSAQLKAGT